MRTPRHLATALLAVGFLLGGPTPWSARLAPTPAVAQPAPEIPISRSIKILGAVARPTTFREADLRRFPVTTQNVVFNTRNGPTRATYTGVLLWMLLEEVGIRAVPDTPNGILRRTIEFTATDDYRIVLGAGEINPIFGGEQAIIAYEENGGRLTEGGFARLVMPGDKAGGRNVTSIVRIEVR